MGTDWAAALWPVIGCLSEFHLEEEKEVNVCLST